MNRLHDAIAQARLAREAVLAGRQLDATPKPAPAPTRDVETPTEAWKALPRRVIERDALVANRVVTPTDCPEAAPFDIMRTKLIATAREKGWRRIAITSPTPGCGKSTVSLNLAFSLARQSNLRSILCELDMRRPALANILGITQGNMLSRVLAGREPFGSHAVRYGEGLAIGTNARPARNPAEMFHAPEMDEALDAIQSKYEPDFMLFDMPPMLVGDDMLAFAPKADAVLIIAASEVNSVAQIDTCERELAEHCEVAGVVLNKCHHPGEEYGYGGGYYG